VKALGSILLALFVALGVRATAQETAYPLSKAAANLGYTYNFLGMQNAATVSRPGLTILVRPGEQIIEVNDRLVSLDSAPQMVGTEIYVPGSLVTRMRELAKQYPLAAERPPERNIVVVAPSVTRGAITIEVHQLSGSFDLAVSGKAPPSVPITLTLIGSLSRDIPDVLLSRSEVASDVDGRFQAVVSPAPGFYSGALLTLVATSLPGVNRASAKFVLHDPNDNASIPGDEYSKNVR